MVQRFYRQLLFGYISVSPEDEKDSEYEWPVLLLQKSDRESLIFVFLFIYFLFLSLLTSRDFIRAWVGETVVESRFRLTLDAIRDKCPEIIEDSLTVGETNLLLFKLYLLFGRFNESWTQ